jgi:hypothetical protein
LKPDSARFSVKLRKKWKAPATRYPYKYFNGFLRAERIYRLMFIQKARMK